jgi:hypothetical protein
MSDGLSIPMNPFDRLRASGTSIRPNLIDAVREGIFRQDLQDERDGKNPKRQALHPVGGILSSCQKFPFFGEPSPPGNQAQSRRIKVNQATFLPPGDARPGRQRAHPGAIGNQKFPLFPESAGKIADITPCRRLGGVP